MIEKILTHLGLQAWAPPQADARGLALQAACRSQALSIARPGNTGRGDRLRLGILGPINSV